MNITNVYEILKYLKIKTTTTTTTTTTTIGKNSYQSDL